MDKERYDYYKKMLNAATTKREAKGWFRKAKEELLIQELDKEYKVGITGEKCCGCKNKLENFVEYDNYFFCVDCFVDYEMNVIFNQKENYKAKFEVVPGFLNKLYGNGKTAKFSYPENLERERSEK